MPCFCIDLVTRAMPMLLVPAVRPALLFPYAMRTFADAVFAVHFLTFGNRSSAAQRLAPADAPRNWRERFD
jgi:hypothetical protein